MHIRYRTDAQARTAAHRFRIKAIALALASILAFWPGPGRAAKQAESEPAPRSSKTAPQATPSSPETASAQGAHLAQWATPWGKRLDARAFAPSEKLDGVRAVWGGKSLRFRSGRAIAAPPWFLAALPAQALDQEWRAVRYMVFDAPAIGKTFRQRYQRAQELVAAARHRPWAAGSSTATATARPKAFRALLAFCGCGQKSRACRPK